MPGSITDTSPLLYLGRIGALAWLNQLFGTVWVPSAVLRELDEGRVLGRLVPSVAPLVDLLAASGMWLSPDIRRRILSLAGEDDTG
jgi:predicted nucleic acid-binding protein